jgi:hypothetical protein
MISMIVLDGRYGGCWVQRDDREEIRGAGLEDGIVGRHVMC